MVRAAGQSQKAPAEAITTYQEILGRLPDFAPAKKQLAALYVDDPAKWEEGYKLASSARDALPGDRELPQIQAILSYHLKDYSNAVQLLMESSRTRPLDARGLFYMGMSRFQTGDRTGSKEALSAALAAGLPEKLAPEANRTLAELQKPN
jgi:predicted Zn-dependent protease